MAVAVVIDVPAGNQQFYEQIIPTLFPGGKLPEGWQMHMAGPSQDRLEDRERSAVTGRVRGVRP